MLVGVRRAFAPDWGSPPGVADRPHPTRSKIAASILAILSVAIFGLFIFSTLIFARRLPASADHPQVGQKAPDFTLSDTSGKPVSLSELLSASIKGETGSEGARASNGQEARTAPKGVLLVFYRGYW